MTIRSNVLDQKYVFEYDVGLWTFGTVEVLKERKTGVLKICKTVQKTAVHNSAEAMSRLHRLQELHHAHISAVTDVLEDHARIYVISDKCDGGDVAEWISRVQEEGNWLQEQTVAEYVRQALMALVHAHGNRVCHRDLRPSSFALTSKLPDAKVLVTDLGLADIFDPRGEIIQPSANLFLAPEVGSVKFNARQAGSLDTSADIWSIGAITCQLLVGMAPSQSDSYGDGVLAALARVGGQALIRPKNAEFDAWSERSDLSRDFVRTLLRYEAIQRPTAAAALQHPWIRGCASIDPELWDPTCEKTQLLKNRLLCYTIAVILLPAQIQYCDLVAFRKCFGKADADRDGFVGHAAAYRLLRDRGAPSAEAVTALDAVDVVDTGVFSLSALAAADVLVHGGFCSQDVDGTAGTSPGHIYPRLLRAFFEAFGDGQRMVAEVAAVNSHYPTSTVHEMEAHAGIQYDEILMDLSEVGLFDGQALIESILDNQGRGTPLAICHSAFDTDEFDVTWGEILGMDRVQDLVKGFFQTCGLGSAPQFQSNCEVMSMPLVSFSHDWKAGAHSKPYARVGLP